MRTIEEQFDRKWLTKEDRPRFAEAPDRRVAEYWFLAGAAAKQEQVLAIIKTVIDQALDYNRTIIEITRRIKEQSEHSD